MMTASALARQLLVCGIAAPQRRSSRLLCSCVPGGQFLAPPAPPEDGIICCISHFEAKAFATSLHSRKPSSGCERVDLPSDIGGLTVDIGLRRPKSAELTPSCLRLGFAADDRWASVPWSFLSKVAKKQRAGVWQCWEDDDDDPEKVEGMSDLTRRTASLMPAHEGAVPPTATLGGFNMHRVKGVDPSEDTARKLAALGGGGRLKGGRRPSRVLDVCTGLGYTAIGAAQLPSVTEVVTIELDPLMVYLQRSNPWSAALFEDGVAVEDKMIRRLLGDATQVLPTLPDGYFDAAIHDPPTNAMSGELYSLEVYRGLRRVLRRGGVLFHYIGDPSSRTSGKMFKGVIERLREAGFDAKTTADAFGVTAVAK
jgi:predicted methyltransferase